MRGTIRTTTVQGQVYEVWSDFFARCTYAKNADGDVKAISSSGYIRNDLTVRKAIAAHFGLGSFRK